MTLEEVSPDGADTKEEPSPDAAGTDKMDGLLAHFAATRDPQARRQLILHHQKLARFAAARFAGHGETLEDLVQVGTVGLIHALDRYDPAHGVKFSTYALPTIVGEIKRHLRDKTWHVKVPRWLQEMSQRARRTQQSLSVRLGRSPTVREIAEAIGASEEDTLVSLEIGSAANALSLDTPLDSEAGGAGATLVDLIGQLDRALHDLEAYADLRRALDLLESRERQVIHLRFFEELPQRQISQRLGISQMHVSRLERRALLRLRHILDDVPSARA